MTYRYRIESEDIRDKDIWGGWVGLHRFFGMYVVNFTQYGEGQDEYGPFANKKDGLDMFGAVVAVRTCPFRKSYPRVAMMQPRQDGRSGNVSVSLDRATQRRILVQR